MLSNVIMSCRRNVSTNAVCKPLSTHQPARVLVEFTSLQMHVVDIYECMLQSILSICYGLPLIKLQLQKISMICHAQFVLEYLYNCYRLHSNVSRLDDYTSLKTLIRTKRDPGWIDGSHFGFHLNLLVWLLEPTGSCMCMTSSQSRDVLLCKMCDIV